jgi:hypothetical protein
VRGKRHLLALDRFCSCLIFAIKNLDGLPEKYYQINREKTKKKLVFILEYAGMTSAPGSIRSNCFFTNLTAKL